MRLPIVHYYAKLNFLDRKSYMIIILNTPFFFLFLFLITNPTQNLHNYDNLNESECLSNDC